jgi:hypothetical protein
MAAMLAVRSGVAALFCPESWQAASRLVPRLRASGWDVLDTTEVDLDRDGRVVIAPLAVGLDAAALALLPGDRNDGARAVPGRYPVAAWVDVAGSDAMPMTMAAGVARASAGVPDLDAGAAPSAIEAVTAMLRHADCVLSPTTSARDLAETLARAVP